MLKNGEYVQVRETKECGFIWRYSDGLYTLHNSSKKYAEYELKSLTSKYHVGDNVRIKRKAFNNMPTIKKWMLTHRDLRRMTFKISAINPYGTMTLINELGDNILVNVDDVRKVYNKSKTKKDAAIVFLLKTNKPVYCQVGFSYKGAKKYISSVEEEIKTLNEGCYAHFDIEETDGYVLVNYYSSNDMY